MLDYSFSSDSYTKNISKLEESILRQYKRLGFGEDTIQYSINSLNYEDLPDHFPEEFTKENRKCLRLASCGFFQMLTYSIFQFLLSNRHPQKDEIIKKIRRQIADKTFMEDSPSTKGFLLKGIKMMYDYVQLSKGQKPIAHCMWKNDAMPSFSEFWKNLLAKLSIQNIVTAQKAKALDVGLFQILSDYLEVNFSIFYQNNSQFEHQVYFSRKEKSSLMLNIAVYSKNKNKNKKNQCSKILDSSAMIEKNSLDQSLQWNYIVIEDKAQYYRSELERQDISQIHLVDQSVLDEKEQIIRLLKCRTKSQLNYQPSNNQLWNQQEHNSPPASELKDAKGLQTTRTKKSYITTGQKSNKRSHLGRIQKSSSEQLRNNLELIKLTFNTGQRLINQMKDYCKTTSAIF